MKPFPFHGVNDNLRPHLQAILDGNEYILPTITCGYSPTILDIGANVGAFTYWISQKLPGSFVYAYEPDATNAEAFERNMTDAELPAANYRLFRGAVSDSSKETLDLFTSEVNTGMHSVYKSLTNTVAAACVSVPNFHANRLPNCDIMKIDTEGCEVEILKAYLKSHVFPSIICLEFHSRFHYYEIEQMLNDNYLPFSGHFSHPDIGTLTFVHNSLEIK